MLPWGFVSHSAPPGFEWPPVKCCHWWLHSMCTKSLSQISTIRRHPSKGGLGTSGRGQDCLLTQRPLESPFQAEMRMPKCCGSSEGGRNLITWFTSLQGIQTARQKMATSRISCFVQVRGTSFFWSKSSPPARASKHKLEQSHQACCCCCKCHCALQRALAWSHVLGSC